MEKIIVKYNLQFISYCIRRSHALRVSVTNPYGRTKLMPEEILGDVYTADNGGGM